MIDVMPMPRLTRWSVWPECVAVSPAIFVRLSHRSPQKPRFGR